jgi:hypothetical protein
MKTLFTFCLAAICFLPVTGFSQDSTKIQNAINTVSYSVPSSPAFELLPNKPSEVTHLTSPKDIAANFQSFVDGGKLRSGAAVDIRPFAYIVGPLKKYQNSAFKRILWATVLSAGTASESKSSSDVYIGAGLRIPLIDAGDPRRNKPFIDDLDSADARARRKVGPGPFNESDADYAIRMARLDKLANLDSIRNKFADDHWNSLRWDVGLGVSDRAASGYLKSDSLFADRVGIWTALGFKLGRYGQLTVSGNTAWVKARSDTSEHNRDVIGARARFFLTGWLSLSGEYARIYSKYKNANYNENWGHLAIVAEFKVPKLGGWIGLAYGGDSAHRTDSGTKFSFNYAIYTDRLLKKK